MRMEMTLFDVNDEDLGLDAADMSAANEDSPQQATGYQRGSFTLKIRDFQTSGHRSKRSKLRGIRPAVIEADSDRTSCDEYNVEMILDEGSYLSLGYHFCSEMCMESFEAAMGWENKRGQRQSASILPK